MMSSLIPPERMNKYIFPRYEEFWNLFKRRGIRVHFVTDGNPMAFVADLAACGMDGLTTEPYADFKAIAIKYPDMMLAGEGDNRILTYGTKEDIRKMVESMAETGKIDQVIVAQFLTLKKIVLYECLIVP